MPTRNLAPPLGEFELLVLLATMSLGEAAYPLAVTRNIETRTGRKVSRAAVLTTLGGMEDKDPVRSSYGDPTPERGGRPKRFFEVKASGVKAVQESLGRIDTMLVGLEGVLKRR